MAWDVNKIYNLLKVLIRKNQAGGITSTDFFYTWNSEQASYHNDLLGRWQARNNGKTGANTGLLLNETVLGELAVFTKTTPLTIASGAITKPTDFAYRLAARKGDHSVTFINSGQIPYVKKSVLNPPSETKNNYYAIEYGNTYQLLPNTITGDIDFDYISNVVDVVWGFSLVGGRQVYDATTSVQPLWMQDAIITITKRTLKSLGVSFKDADFQNAGNTAILTGDI